MEMTTKTLTLLAIVSSTCLPMRATAQEILSKIRNSRPTTLQALKDIEHNIKDEIKTIKKTTKHQHKKYDRDYQELQAARADIKNQIRNFADTTKNRLPSGQQIKDKAQQFKDKVKSTAEHLPSGEQIKNKAQQIKNKAQQIKDKAQEEALVVKHQSKRMWKRLIRGVTYIPSKIKNLFTGKKR